jgi:hypothetical protein
VSARGKRLAHKGTAAPRNTPHGNRRLSIRGPVVHRQVPSSRAPSVTGRTSPRAVRHWSDLAARRVRHWFESRRAPSVTGRTSPRPVQPWASLGRRTAEIVDTSRRALCSRNISDQRKSSTCRTSALAPTSPASFPTCARPSLTCIRAVSYHCLNQVAPRAIRSTDPSPASQSLGRLSSRCGATAHPWTPSSRPSSRPAGPQSGPPCARHASIRRRPVTPRASAFSRRSSRSRSRLETRVSRAPILRTNQPHSPLGGSHGSRFSVTRHTGAFGPHSPRRQSSPVAPRARLVRALSLADAPNAARNTSGAPLCSFQFSQTRREVAGTRPLLVRGVVRRVSRTASAGAWAPYSRACADLARAARLAPARASIDLRKTRRRTFGSARLWRPLIRRCSNGPARKCAPLAPPDTPGPNGNARLWRPLRRRCSNGPERKCASLRASLYAGNSKGPRAVRRLAPAWISRFSPRSD